MDTETVPISPPAAAPPRPKPRKPGGARAFWVRQILNWHWISAAISLVGMIIFAVTGITLNHAGDIAAAPVVTERSATMPQDLLAALPALEGRHPVPATITAWARDAMDVRAAGEADWSADEIYLAMTRPGGDAWLSIDRASGEVLYEDTWRGWIAYFNDLHKGRNTGVAWAWFIDIFALACVVFCLSGLGLLWLKAVARPSTWPLVAAGVVIPLVLILLFIH